MATVVTLDARNSNQVGSAQKVSVLTGEPNTWLLIYSGFAEQNQYADGTSYWIFGESTAETDAIVNVTLDNLSGVLLEYATTGSLSGIFEEGTWGDWYVNSTSLSLQDNGDLILTANTTVIGGSPEAGFNSFAYYVSAKVVLDAASISGTIRWKKTLASPRNTTHFAVTANMQLPTPPGTLIPITEVEATGVEGAVDASDPIYYYVPYTITGALLGKTVSVAVIANPSSFSGEPQGTLIVNQISGPTAITLTVTNRHATNVDFEMDSVPLPK
jgi:hypothetical protein